MVIVGNGGLNSKTILCTIWLVLPWTVTYGSCFATEFPFPYLHYLVICIILNTIWHFFFMQSFGFFLTGCGNITQDPGTCFLLQQNLRCVCTLLLLASKSTYIIWYLQTSMRKPGIFVNSWILVAIFFNSSIIELTCVQVSDQSHTFAMELERLVCNRATPRQSRNYDLKALLCTLMAFPYTTRIPEVN